MSFKTLYNEIKAEVLSITGTTTASTFSHTMVWNNQLDSILKADDYAIPLPSVLIELSTENFGDLSQGYSAIDMGVKFHIIQEYYNGNNMSENLNIFDLRDSIVKHFYNYQPSQGGFFNLRNEYQDYDHSNVYHYILDYVFHFIDDTQIKPKYFGTATTITFNTDIILP